MTRAPFFLVLAVVAANVGARAQTEVRKSPAGEATPLATLFDVSIEQDGQRLQPVDGTVTIARTPFTVVIRMGSPMLVLVNASHNPATYKAFRRNLSSSTTPGFAQTGLAEGTGNPDQTIFVVDEAPNAWFVDAQGQHRFDGPCEPGPPLVCRRTIRQLSYGTDEVLPVASARHARLFLTFVKSDWAPDYSSRTDRHRQAIEVRLR